MTRLFYFSCTNTVFYKLIIRLYQRTNSWVINTFIRFNINIDYSNQIVYITTYGLWLYKHDNHHVLLQVVMRLYLSLICILYYPLLSNKIKYESFRSFINIQDTLIHSENLLVLYKFLSLLLNNYSYKL
jgi:hypothetical protein